MSATSIDGSNPGGQPRYSAPVYSTTDGGMAGKQAERSGLEIQSRFWLTRDGVSLAGRGRIELLRLIGETGSIRQAALAMGMSYKSAWDAVDAMNKRAGTELITRQTGGSKGGGAQLSEAGLKLVALFQTLEDQHAKLIGELNQMLGD